MNNAHQILNHVHFEKFVLYPKLKQFWFSNKIVNKTNTTYINTKIKVCIKNKSQRDFGNEVETFK